jgi:hypothetical protein
MRDTRYPAITAANLIVSCIAIAISGCRGDITEPEAELSKEAEVRDIDLGVLREDQSASCKFVIKNNSKKSFSVVDVRKSCGCEASDVRVGERIPAGGVLRLTYALANAKGGIQSGRLTLTTDSDDEHYKIIEFRLKATFPKRVWSVPEEVELSRDTRGEGGECELLVCVGDAKMLSQFSEVMTSRGLVNVRLTGKTEHCLMFKVRVAGDAPIGPANDYISLFFADTKATRLDVRVRSSNTAGLVRD